MALAIGALTARDSAARYAALVLLIALVMTGHLAPAGRRPAVIRAH
ncbi:hypothetical protein [Streptomyces flaveus]|uniref:Uncharacterized protein n=1 Tax=Streptomyces flaveus TaxID=66370 RepID=A0A917QDJ2_9ACTN|nr:hypothetical protein [Streptomyces flaveus]GGK45385.1 hypothetical protein GCM10010094_01370 [Streptomyces flaveus]